MYRSEQTGPTPETMPIPAEAGFALSIIAHLKDIVFQIDSEGRWLFLNPAWKEITGFLIADTIGQSALDSVFPADREQYHPLFQSLLKGDQERCDCEMRYLTCDGGFRWVSVRACPMPGPGGTIIGIAGTLTDITDRHQLTDELKRSNEVLEEFTTIASHDLQEPLRKILAFGGRLKAKVDAAEPTEYSEHLDRILGAAERMQGLIADLLTFSRITTRQRSLQLVDLNEVIRRVLVTLATRIQRSGATVTVGELPVIVADPFQMRQLFHNLLENALKFRGAAPPVITVQATGRNQITVTDNGIGFDEHHATRIFGIFERLHDRNEYEGTGIGLALCRRIVERHGGSIVAHGIPDGGASFIIELSCTTAGAVE